MPGPPEPRAVLSQQSRCWDREARLHAPICWGQTHQGSEGSWEGPRNPGRSSQKRLVSGQSPRPWASSLPVRHARPPVQNIPVTGKADPSALDQGGCGGPPLTVLLDRRAWHTGGELLGPATGSGRTNTYSQPPTARAPGAESRLLQDTAGQPAALALKVAVWQHAGPGGRTTCPLRPQSRGSAGPAPLRPRRADQVLTFLPRVSVVC